MDKVLFSKLVSYPFIYKSELFDSIRLVQNITCIKCKRRDCISFFKESTKNTYYRCDKGFDNFKLVFNNNEFILNGLILTANQEVSKGLKVARKDYFIHYEIIQSHINHLKDLHLEINKKITENIEENISVFHDVKTSIGIVTSCSEILINDYNGNGFSDRLSNSPQALRDLYDAIDLVNSQLGMIDIIVNTQSITYGNKSNINIYQLFHRVAKLFKHRADKKNIKIHLEAYTQIPDIMCYESIEFVPITLLDNAIKYSEPNKSIKIFFKVEQKSVEVVVSSYGPIVKDEFRESIFNKYVKGESAIKYSKEGIGVGLWICRKILEEHGTQIVYKYEYLNDNLGYNKFEFEICRE